MIKSDNYAPRYFLDNHEKYQHLLINPYSNITGKCPTPALQHIGKKLRGWHRLSKSDLEKALNASNPSFAKTTRIA
jgi:hypothetical protein